MLPAAGVADRGYAGEHLIPLSSPSPLPSLVLVSRADNLFFALVRSLLCQIYMLRALLEYARTFNEEDADGLVSLLSSLSFLRRGDDQTRTRN